MSNGLAIAAATATLRSLLDAKLGISNVTVRSPDKARDGLSGDQVNLFLYHVEVDAAWRNMDMPRQLKPGETGHPPLPLSLFYLLTAFDDTEAHSYSLLGRAMAALHDHPLLDAGEIQSATANDLGASDLHEQIERVRITLQPLSIEEMYKLWAAFQTQYRPSVGYQVSVVLIESTRPAKAPLPVLTRGKDDRGVAAQGNVESPFPLLLDLTLPEGKSGLELGDLLTISGRHLDAGALEVRLSNPHLPAPGPVTIQSSTANEVVVRLDADPTQWVAGLYTVAVVVTSGDDVRATNELPVTLAPRITTALPLDVTRNPDQSADITLQFEPRFVPGQRAALLIGDREVPAEPLPPPPPPQTPTDTLTFKVKNAPLGKHFLRLRIDGVDSLLVQRPKDKPPLFDANQVVTIHD